MSLGALVRTGNGRGPTDMKPDAPHGEQMGRPMAKSCPIGWREQAPGRCGWRWYAPGRNRTCDLPLRRRSLYPLSYRGVDLRRCENAAVWCARPESNRHDRSHKILSLGRLPIPPRAQPLHCIAEAAVERAARGCSQRLKPRLTGPEPYERSRKCVSTFSSCPLTSTQTLAVGRASRRGMPIASPVLVQ